MALPRCTVFVGFRGTLELEKWSKQGYRGSQVDCFSVRADSRTFAGPFIRPLTIVLVILFVVLFEQRSSFSFGLLTSVITEDLIVVREGEMLLKLLLIFLARRCIVAVALFRGLILLFFPSRLFLLGDFIPQCYFLSFTLR